MEIDRNTVEYVAELSKIALTEAEKDKMIVQLRELVSYFEMLSLLDTKDTEPLSHVFSTTNVLREDIVKPSFDREAILENAPSNNGEYFVVPKTLE